MFTKWHLSLIIILIVFLALFLNSRLRVNTTLSSDIYISQFNGSFGSAVLVGPPILTKCNEDNPSPGADGLLYFDSNRKDPLGGECFCAECKSIWSSKYENGSWLLPVKVSDGSTPFVTSGGNMLYFSGGDLLSDGQCTTTSCLWRSRKINNTWSNPELVARSKANKNGEPLIVISKPTLTSDGTLLFFVYFDNNQIVNPGGADNTQIGVVAKTNEFAGFKVGKVIEGLAFEKGWGTPYDLPSPVNTPGSEDSSWIVPDGRELYFAYRGQKRPDRLGQKSDAYDMYVAYPYKNWEIQNLGDINSEANDAAEGLLNDRSKIFFVRWPR